MAKGLHELEWIHSVRRHGEGAIYTHQLQAQEALHRSRMITIAGMATDRMSEWY